MGGQRLDWRAAFRTPGPSQAGKIIAAASTVGALGLASDDPVETPEQQRYKRRVDEDSLVLLDKYRKRQIIASVQKSHPTYTLSIDTLRSLEAKGYRRELLQLIATAQRLQPPQAV